MIEIKDILQIVSKAGEAIMNIYNSSNEKDFSEKVLFPARVKWFDKSKGFGFANIFQSNEDIFLHMEVLKRYGLSDLQAGEAIAISITDGPRGRMAEGIFSWDEQQSEKENKD